MFWLEVMMVVVTAASAGISYLLFRSQVEPEVVVFADADVDRPNLVSLVITNIGKGVAKRVRFATSEPIPTGMHRSEPVIDRGPLIHGIPSLGPGARRVVLWGDVDSLLEALGRRTIRITAAYETDGRGPWGSQQLTTESLIEIGSFIGTAIPQNFDKRAADSLDQIARTFENVATAKRISGAG
jgi:hypothetical protein